MQVVVFFIFVAFVVAVSRKLASIGDTAKGGSKTRVTGSARRRRGASERQPGQLGNELADTLRAWVEEKGVQPTIASPYGERVDVQGSGGGESDVGSGADFAPAPTPEVDVPEPPPLPPLHRADASAPSEVDDTPPLEAVRARMNESAAPEPIAAIEPPNEVPNEPLGDTAVESNEPRTAALPSVAALPPQVEPEEPLAAPDASEAGDEAEADDLATAIGTAVRAALDAPPGPELALSSSLSRPVSDAYTAVLVAGGFDEASAESAFGRVANGSAFFGLTPTGRGRLDAARLAEAALALRRASPALARAFAADLERLDAMVAGLPRSRAAVAVLRRLVPSDA